MKYPHEERGGQLDTPILDMLTEYAGQGGERWHMPGHKGGEPARGDFLRWMYDVTEIGAMDRVPNPVEQSERLMAETYGADRTWYSVQGATLPVMAAILAANPPGSTLWVDRTMHRSVLGALMIGGYHVRWLYPTFLRAGVMLPLAAFPDDFAGGTSLVLTRPTYDGLAGPLRSVIDRAHQQGLRVIVDEAHGSHWAGPGYPESALALGADLVAHGVHKTETSLTQTGLLHLKGPRVQAADVDRWWRLLGTSSPSYLLLASLDRLQWERHQPESRTTWQEFRARVELLWNTLEQRRVPLLQPWAASQGIWVDPARLTVLAPGADIQERVLPWGELEKATPGSATFFLSPVQDLSVVQQALAGGIPVSAQDPFELDGFPHLDAALTPRETWGRPARRVRLAEARGAVARDALTPYPPGIPVVVPGEVISGEMVDWLERWQATVTGPIQGISQEEGQQWVWIIE